MINKPKSIAVISCLLVMLSTILAFYLLFENLFEVKIQWLSLLFLLLSEIIVTVKFLLIRKQAIIAGTHITSSIIHVIITFLVLTLFMLFYDKSIKPFVLINIVLVSVLIISDLLIYYTDYRMTKNGNKQLDSQNTFYRCLTRIQQLSTRHKNTSFYADLCKIEELLRYSDNSTITGDEAKIEAMISELSLLLDDECSASSLVYAKANTLMTTIQERTAQMKVIKRGRY